jgi:hypothetical protein
MSTIKMMVKAAQGFALRGLILLRESVKTETTADSICHQDESAKLYSPAAVATYALLHGL